MQNFLMFIQRYVAAITLGTITTLYLTISDEPWIELYEQVLICGFTGVFDVALVAYIIWDWRKNYR